MSTSVSPYQSLSAKSFWKAVRENHYFDLENLSQPIRLSLEDKIATAGSCFAQHIGRYMKGSGAEYLDLEPRPIFLSDKDAKRFGYEVYSCRYGNIYTVRQLLQLIQESQCSRFPHEVVWEKEGRFFDALRPSVDPVGLDAADQVLAMRKQHLQAVDKMFRSLDVFVFTLGLTEAWVSNEDGTVYPTAAGTIAGSHSQQKYHFKNFRYGEVMEDLREFWRLLKVLNPSARMLLTVSPVPLNATASEDHVLVASCRSKSILRAVAGDMAEDENDVFYFPSYEIISSHPSRGMFYEPDLRNVNDAGVQLVMKHFFTAFNTESKSVFVDDEIICEEAELEKFAK